MAPTGESDGGFLLFESCGLQKVRISNVMQKLNVKGRSQAVVELVRLGELKI